MMIDVVGKTGRRLPSGSLEARPRWMTASKPLRSASSTSRVILENGRHVDDGPALLERTALVKVAVEADHFVPALSNMGVMTEPM